MNNKPLVEIIKENNNLIYSIINKYAKYYEIEDLYQVSIIGIMKAYQNYKQGFGVKFTTYAYKYILSEVLLYINNNKTIKVSRDYLKLYKKILEARTLLTQKLMKEPSNYEISLFLEIDEAIINEVMRYQERVKSLDEVVSDEGREICLIDQIPIHNNDTNTYLIDELRTLTEEEQYLINLRYFEGKTQSEIAKIFGTKQVNVSRIEHKTLKKLKNKLLQPL